MPLPLANQKSSHTALPDKETMLKCMQVATTEQGAKYFQAGFTDRVAMAKMTDKLRPVLQELAKFVEYIGFRRNSTGKPWSGDTAIPTAFQNFQQRLAESVASIVSNKQIVFEFAVSPKSELMVGYSSEGKALDKNTQDAIVKLFNAWLAEGNMVVKKGIIYEADDQGKIVQGMDGQLKRAPAEALQSRIHEALEDYMLQKGTVDFKVQEHAYVAPTQEPTAGFDVSQ